jgi:hypothetical protein
MDTPVDEPDRDHAGDDADAAAPNPYKHLPEPTKPEDMIATVDTRQARDPEDGRDTDRDFMIRYSGG